MSKPRLLDLFCGAGGAAMGYHRAGFEVVGVDIHPQPHYPFDFFQMDAFDFLPHVGVNIQFDAIHASPPCQEYSSLRGMAGVAGKYPMLVDDVRVLLMEASRPFVIENVPGSPVAFQATLDGRFGVRLTGAMFNLSEDGYGLIRERWFETSWPISQPIGGKRQPLRVGVHGGGQPGRAGGRDRRVMGIDWMTRDELNEAIPPAYTEWIGRQLMAAIAVEQVAS